MALGVPATAHAISQDPAPASPAKPLIEEDGNYESAFLMDLVPSVRQHLWDAFLRCYVSMRIVRHTPSDCRPGKMRWAIEVEEAHHRASEAGHSDARWLQCTAASLQLC